MDVVLLFAHHREVMGIGVFRRLRSVPSIRRRVEAYAVPYRKEHAHRSKYRSSPRDSRWPHRSRRYSEGFVLTKRRSTVAAPWKNHRNPFEPCKETREIKCERYDWTSSTHPLVKTRDLRERKNRWINRFANRNIHRFFRRMSARLHGRAVSAIELRSPNSARPQSQGWAKVSTMAGDRMPSG